MSEEKKVNVPVETAPEEQAPEKKPAPKKKEQPKKDSTIIKNLRKELRDIKESYGVLEKQLDQAHKKAEIYFNEANKAKEKLTEAENTTAYAREALMETVNGALKSFYNSTR